MLSIATTTREIVGRGDPDAGIDAEARRVHGSLATADDILGAVEGLAC